MKIVSTFPIRLFRWFFTRQILLSLLLFAGIGTGLWLWSASRGLTPDALEAAHEMILFSLALGFAAVVLIAAFMSRRLLVPLGRLIEKTRRMRESPFDAEENTPEELTFDEPGEWFELERALNRLGRDLRNKTVRLSREKTELRAIMSSVGEAVLAISKDKRVLFYNSQFAYLFNVQTPRPDLLISEILRSPDVLGAYNEALASGGVSRSEVQLKVSDEKMPHEFQLSVAPLVKKHNQEVYGAVGIFHDITELKRADRIRIEFVGNVSHELRTPLTTINGYLQTLVADVAKQRYDSAPESLKIVTHNVGRLKSLVEDLLDLSSIESGKALNMERVRVREITETVLKQVNPSRHALHMSYDFDEMEADPQRLEQVLRNLMENAVRYVPAGKNIEIRWRRNAKGKLELSVKDDGPGIAAEHQSRLFERFYRVDEGRSRDQGGTGIGLSLVKHIVQRHGGAVTVRSDLGHGAEFICEFPDSSHSI